MAERNESARTRRGKDGGGAQGQMVWKMTDDLAAGLCYEAEGKKTTRTGRGEAGNTIKFEKSAMGMGGGCRYVS